MAKRGERPDIEEKLELISERIVRGKEAKNNRVVIFHRLNRIATIIASVLTGMGISNPLLTISKGGNAKIQDAFTDFNGLPIWLLAIGIVIFVALIVARQFFVEEGYEKKAIQSVSVHDSFIDLEPDFKSKLQVKEPMSELNPIHEKALALEKSFIQVLPSEDFCKDKIQTYVNKMIEKQCRYWNSNMPDEERIQQ